MSAGRDRREPEGPEPQGEGNRYVESFIGGLNDELLGREVFDTLLEAKVLVERWRRHSGEVRWHSSLGYRPPAPAAIRPLPPGTNLKTGTRTGGWSWCNPLITLVASVSYRNNLRLDSKAYVDFCRVHGGKYDAGDVTPPLSVQLGPEGTYHGSRR
jgi:hypothetical protein